VVLVASGTASAQPATAAGNQSGAARWEVGGGWGLSGGFTGPSALAELTANGESAGGFDLFSADGEVESGLGVVASIAFYVTPSVAVEAGLRYSQPTLMYHLANDVENAPPATAEETLSRYVFSGSLVWHFRSAASSSRFAPFIAGGGGYVRDLHQGNELIETGGEFHALGGVKYWLGSGRRRFGLRGQAGFSVISGGFDFRESSRTLPIASASLLYLF
jgi:hypothetical protein